MSLQAENTTRQLLFREYQSCVNHYSLLYLLPFHPFRYEPEIFPAVDYKLKGSGTKKYKYSLRIFESGAISVTASDVSLLHDAVQHIYPLIFQFKKQKPNASHLSHMKKRKKDEEDPSSISRRTFKRRRRGSCEEEDDVDLQDYVVDDGEVEEESTSSEEEEAQFTSDEEED